MEKLIDYLSSETKIKDKQLLEKDLILHHLLVEINRNKYLSQNLIFKGGTCLTKCYYDYYRFSEDLDFSWAKQDEFEDKSQKEIRRTLSIKITKISGIFQNISEKLNMEFKPEKSNNRYIEFGGSNKLVTFKLWYKSCITNHEQFIKLQINFLEHFLYKFRESNANSIVGSLKKEEFEFLFPQYGFLLEKPRVSVYDIKEILIEKVRAVLTRKGVKARDFIDIFLITKKENIDINLLRKQITEKTRFMLRYDKYIQNLKDFNLEKFVLGEEEKLLLKPIPGGFEKFLRETHIFMSKLAEKLIKNVKTKRD